MPSIQKAVCSLTHHWKKNNVKFKLGTKNILLQSYCMSTVKATFFLISQKVFLLMLKHVVFCIVKRNPNSKRCPSFMTWQSFEFTNTVFFNPILVMRSSFFKLWEGTTPDAKHIVNDGKVLTPKGGCNMAWQLFCWKI